CRACRKKVGKSGWAESFREPGPGIRPFLPRLVDADVQGNGDCFVTEPGEVAQLDHACGQRVLPGQAVESLVQLQEPVVVRRGGMMILQLDALQTAAVPVPFLAASILDEDATHGLRGG